MIVFLIHTQKPFTETRLFDKIAPALQTIPGISTYVLGCAQGASPPLTGGENCFVGKTQKNWRLINMYRCWQKLAEVRPGAVVVASPELIPIGFAYRLIYNRPLILDVQENIGLNFLYQAAYKGSLFQSKIAARLLKWFQKTAINLANAAWLAEEIYGSQLVPIGQKVLLLENKIPTYPISAERKETTSTLLFSGVITRESGIERALKFFDQWSHWMPNWKLTIAGYAPDPEVQRMVVDYTARNSAIEVLGISDWVKHEAILEALQMADAVLISYVETKANRGKRPTKWFEAAFFEKPCIVPESNHWEHLEGTIQVNYENATEEDVMAIISKINKPLYTSKSEDYVFDTHALSDHFRSVILKNASDPDR